jgi:membrane protease YdiL (CAAX protease family)
MNVNPADENDNSKEGNGVEVLAVEPSKSSIRVPWTPRDAIVVLIWFLIIITFGALLIRKVLSSFMPEGAPLITMFVSYLISLLLLKHFTVDRGAQWSDLGIKPFNFLYGLGLAIGAFLVTRVFIFIYAIIAQALGLHQSKDVLEKLPDLFGKGFGGFLLAVLVVAIIAPIVEELFFRGFVYASFRQSWGVATAAILSSVLFALFHQDPFTYIPIMVIGIALALLYENTGSIWPSVMLHSLNNLISVVMLYYLRVIIRMFQ